MSRHLSTHLPNVGVAHKLIHYSSGNSDLDMCVYVQCVRILRFRGRGHWDTTAISKGNIWCVCMRVCILHKVCFPGITVFQGVLSWGKTEMLGLLGHAFFFSLLSISFLTNKQYLFAHCIVPLRALRGVFN